MTKIAKKEKVEVYKTNNFLNSGYKFSLVQQRIIHYVYSAIQDYVYAVANGTKVNDVQLTLYEDAYIYIPVQSLDKTTNAQRTTYTAFRGLKDLDISQQGKSIESFILSAHRKDNTWRVLLPSTAVKFFIEKANQGVTALENILYISASSRYTVAIYEQLKQRFRLKKWYVAPDEFCELIQTSESAKKNYAKLRIDVIDVAQKELKELFDTNRSALYFDYKEEREGRGGKVVRIIFTIHTKEEKLSPQQLNSQSADDLMFISDTLKKLMIDIDISKHRKKANKEFINRALSKLQDTGSLGKFAERLDKLLIKEDAKGNNPLEKGALVRYILEEDYNVE